MSRGAPPAWLGDPALREQVQERLEAHRVAGTLVQGPYQRPDPSVPTGFWGCALGALLPLLATTRTHPSPWWHERVTELCGLPTAVCELIDQIDDSLPAGLTAEFAVTAADSITCGADLGTVAPRVLLEVLANPERGAARHTRPESPQRAGVQAVTALYLRRAQGRRVGRAAWNAALREAHLGACVATVATLDRHAAGVALLAARHPVDFGAVLRAWEDTVTWVDPAAHDYSPREPASPWPWLAARLHHHLCAAPAMKGQ